jgi:hypothetical protein
MPYFFCNNRLRPGPQRRCDIARSPSVRYCAETYERDPPRDDCQQTLDARYQGPRPLALARLTLSLPALPDQYLYAFDSL